jgi:hypothetical protein
MNKYSVLAFAWEALLLESVGVGFLGRYQIDILDPCTLFIKI